MSNKKSDQPPDRKKPGRNGKYERWLTEDGLLLLQGWARAGLTDEQIAHNCGVTTTTLYNWKSNHVEIFEALKEGKEVIDLMVENALLKRALGFSYDETMVEEGPDGTKTRVTTKMVIPDTTAQIFWLKNRKKAEWRDNAERLEMEREKLELAKRLTDAQIAKINSDIGVDDTEFVIGFDEEIETNGWSK